jgi:hypothetical protein
MEVVCDIRTAQPRPVGSVALKPRERWPVSESHPDSRVALEAHRDGSLLVRSSPAGRDQLDNRGAEPARMGSSSMGERWLRVPFVRVERRR